MLILVSTLAFGCQLITNCYIVILNPRLTVLLGKVLQTVGGEVHLEEGVTGGYLLFMGEQICPLHALSTVFYSSTWSQPIMD